MMQTAGLKEQGGKLMKTEEELYEFYQKELMGDLKALEAERKRLINKLVILTAIIAGGAVVFLVPAAMQIQTPVIIFLPVVIGIVIFAFTAHFLSVNYKFRFKNTVLERIIKFIEPDLNYKPSDYIDKATFMMSQIFKTTPNIYKGDDLVWGRAGATQIRFCELNAIYESGSGKDRHQQTIFKGLFFIADFNKHFMCRTVVLPDTAEKLFGWLGQKLQEMNILRGEIVKLDDPEFENMFVVYSDDQIEARYILSPSLMQRIREFRKKTGRTVYMSFAGSNVYVAISFERNIFEPKIFSTILDFGVIREYYGDLGLAIGIVDDLNLNTRIWSKE